MSLTEIRSPADLRRLSVQELELTCAELRHEIINVSLKNGGHIGASLGAVEIAVALHRIFESPRDSLVWDVGHQAYAHKLLTGRFENFATLRLTGGLAPFLSRQESEHDVYGAGHSSTSISAAMGIAYQNPHWTVAVIGDGALTAGLAFEALNHLAQAQSSLGPLLIVLNDNQMSISENVGAIPEILSQGLAAPFFNLFGVETIGPINGHDLPQLLATLNGIRESRPTTPVLLHVHTQKGKGYGPAETRPATFHGVGPARAPTKIEKVPAPEEKKISSWSEVFCEALIEAADQDPKVVVITPAMSEGSGLVPFAEKFPERFFDVGIAEAHAVTFAAGLAANGWRPVVAIYSTFMQRAYDALVHDVALQNLPVVFGIDRAGLVGNDGPTHHGAFDLAFALPIPELKMLVPETDADLRTMLGAGLAERRSPTLIRYPRGSCPSADSREGGVEYLPWERVGAYDPRAKTLVAIGSTIARARQVQRKFLSASLSLNLYILRQVKPWPEGFVAELSQSRAALFVAEDGASRGGVGENLLAELGGEREFHSLGYPDLFVPHGSLADLEEWVGLSVEQIYSKILGVPAA